MRNFDLAPLYRSTVGFDKMFDLLDRAAKAEAAPSWPPYDVERLGENRYRIIVALPGYSPEDVSVVQQANSLTVSGGAKPVGDAASFLHRGIAAGQFSHAFSLANYVKVVDASFNKGLLSVELVREVPEAMKPRKIEIAKAEPSKRLAQPEAA